MLAVTLPGWVWTITTVAATVVMLTLIAVLMAHVLITAVPFPWSLKVPLKPLRFARGEDRFRQDAFDAILHAQRMLSWLGYPTGRPGAEDESPSQRSVEQGAGVAPAVSFDDERRAGSEAALRRRLAKAAVPLLACFVIVVLVRFGIILAEHSGP